MRQQALAARRAATLQRAGVPVNIEVCVDVAARALAGQGVGPTADRGEMPPPPSKQMAVRAQAISVGCIDAPQVATRPLDQWDTGAVGGGAAHHPQAPGLRGVAHLFVAPT